MFGRYDYKISRIWSAALGAGPCDYRVLHYAKYVPGPREAPRDPAWAAAACGAAGGGLSSSFIPKSFFVLTRHYVQSKQVEIDYETHASRTSLQDYLLQVGDAAPCRLPSIRDGWKCMY
ncbi:hypothetical protein J6590_008950 [Homalodisca vitripennis]|nr:hypothetical protein J6590_008950 [Homalodisca vitripennis]